MSRKPNPEKEIIKAYCKRLNLAINILYDKYRFDRDIIKLISKNKKEEDKLPLSEPTFNTYKNVNDSGRYSTVDARVYKKLFEIIDNILKKEFNKEWSLSLKAYIDIQNLPELKSFDDSKLEGLVDFWIGYSWNEIREKVNIFKMNIRTANEAEVATEKITYKDCNIRPIGFNKVAFELISEKRCVYMIAIIGSRDDLSKVNGINFSYTDSGDDEVKHGSGFIVRVSSEKYFESKAESHLISELIQRDFEKQYSDKLERLVDTQIIVHIFD